MIDNDERQLTGILDLNGQPLVLMWQKNGCKMFCWDRRLKIPMHNDVDSLLDEVKECMEASTRQKWRSIEKEVKKAMGVSLYAGLYDAVDLYPNFGEMQKVHFMFRGYYENEPALLRLLCVYPLQVCRSLQGRPLTLFANP